MITNGYQPPPTIANRKMATHKKTLRVELLESVETPAGPRDRVRFSGVELSVLSETVTSVCTASSAVRCFQAWPDVDRAGLIVQLAWTAPDNAAGLDVLDAATRAALGARQLTQRKRYAAGGLLGALAVELGRWVWLWWAGGA